MMPFFFKSLEQLFKKKSTLLTCSTISIFKMTSNLFCEFSFSGDTEKYLISNLLFLACSPATLIFFSEASIPVTLAPNLHIGSDKSPPPQPISRIFTFLRGFFLSLSLNVLIILFFIYKILMGLNLCKGLNFPSGSHHSFAIFENFSISSLLIVLFFITILTLYPTCILSII